MRLTARYLSYANVDRNALTGLYLDLSEIALLPVGEVSACALVHVKQMTTGHLIFAQD